MFESGIGAEERLEHLIEKIGWKPRPVVFDNDARHPVSVADLDPRPFSMRCGIDDEIAQRPIKRKPARAHLHRLGGRLGHVKFLLSELIADRANQLVKLNQLDRRFDRFLAHQKDRAVGNALKLVEIGEPPVALFFILDKLSSQPHAGNRRAEIVSGCRHEPHAAFHGVFEPGGKRIQSLGRGSDLGWTPFR